MFVGGSRGEGGFLGGGSVGEVQECYQIGGKGQEQRDRTGIYVWEVHVYLPPGGGMLWFGMRKKVKEGRSIDVEESRREQETEGINCDH